MRSWRSSIGWPLAASRRKLPTESTLSPTATEPAARPLRLRLRLLFWISIWLAPVAVISVMQGFDRVERDAGDVRERMFESARANAAQEESVFASGEQVLRALANQPAVRSADSSCPQALANALKGLVYFTNLFRVDAGGRILCAATPPVGPANVAGLDWWQKALRANTFFVASQSPSSPLRGVLPLRKMDGSFDGAIVLSFDVAWLEHLLRNRPLPSDSVLAVFDPAGTTIAANNPGAASAIFAGHPPVRPQEQLVSREAQGRAWTYALLPISTGGIAVGFARRDRALFGGTYLHVATDLLLPVLMLGLAWAAIWIATGRLITRWLEYLRRIAVAYGRGHYSVRPSALAAAPSEFRQLGETISAMAVAVEDRDRRLRSAVEQKSLLIRETHHRVKNNLQIVMSLLSLQARKLRDPGAQQALRQAQFRVNALALVHRILYENEDLGAIQLKDLIEDVSRQIHEASGRESRDINLDFNLVSREIANDLAVPLTLFLVEALTNAFRHAYPGRGAGTVRVSLLPTSDGRLRLAVEDDGIGMTSPEDGTGIGSRLIEAFAHQIGGTAFVRHRQPSGTVVELLFSDPAAVAEHTSDDDEWGTDARSEELTSPQPATSEARIT